MDWKQILKMLIAVLTAIAGTLGVASCVRSGLSPLDSSQASLLGRGKPLFVVNAERSASPRTDAHFASAQGEGATIIAANINLSEYENISHSRDV